MDAAVTVRTARRGRLLAAGGVTAALAALALALGAAPAEAHKTCAFHPSDPDALGSGAANTVACLRDDHRYLDVCDRHGDGHYAYGRVYADPSTLYPALYDQNGASAGCSTYNIAGSYSYNICVQTEGCGSPVYWVDY